MLKKKWKGAGCPYRGGRSGIRRLRGGAFGHGGTDIDREKDRPSKLRLTRPVIQPQRDPRTKRKRQSGHVTTDDRTIWQGFQSTDVPHLDDFRRSTKPVPVERVSEVITDLANDLVRRSDWDPKVFHSPHQHLLDSGEAVDNDDGMIDGSSEFGEADFFAVNYPIANDDDLPRFDCYLDDIFGAFNPRDAEKSSAAIPLALHIVGRPHNAENESFPRDDILAIPKFLAEAKPSERKMILGWLVDTPLHGRSA
ncbi:hypothetical protein MHU86_18830 [Fragilaria crotonensis]|nr:hypothetical protein MHU86_18830 [Fragilaria crotonensis]